MLQDYIEWILVVSGAVTAAAGAMALLFPKQLLRVAFAVRGADGALLFFVRHWGVLLLVVGLALVHSAYYPETRFPILWAAAIEKFAIVALIFFGPLKRTAAMTVIAIADCAFAILYVAYLSGV